MVGAAVIFCRLHDGGSGILGRLHGSISGDSRGNNRRTSCDECHYYHDGYERGDHGIVVIDAVGDGLVYGLYRIARRLWSFRPRRPMPPKPDALFTTARQALDMSSCSCCVNEALYVIRLGYSRRRGVAHRRRHDGPATGRQDRVCRIQS